MYEIYVAVKLSVLQFVQALLDYHASAKDCPLYESLASEDRFHHTWFHSNVMSVFNQMFGQELRLEQRKKNHRSEDSLFWDVRLELEEPKARIEDLFIGPMLTSFADLPEEVPIIPYMDIPVEGEESDSSGSSSLTNLSDTEELKSPATNLRPMPMASP
ncbi:hypothetical protein ARMGADRAFT_1082418 [Armillaria gallica]|uniref:Uncharacterized protein n=1 Tax=Armillaria gallica TaxID=47427 RepID=A0A2H3D619_ARMGA|nr:hypothetical protein ARMGADRAFT_1082418 [Armillaria gallica]